jgi:hypothetical protein
VSGGNSPGKLVVRAYTKASEGAEALPEASVAVAVRECDPSPGRTTSVSAGEALKVTEVAPVGTLLVPRTVAPSRMRTLWPASTPETTMVGVGSVPAAGLVVLASTDVIVGAAGPVVSTVKLHVEVVVLPFPSRTTAWAV